MKEYPHGHLGLLMPSDPNTITKTIIDRIQFAQQSNLNDQNQL